MTENEESGKPFRLVVFADFVCPYSFLAVDQIDRLAREYDLKPLWRPHWLHPDTPPEGFFDKETDYIEDVGEPITACFLTSSMANLDMTTWYDYESRQN